MKLRKPAPNEDYIKIASENLSTGFEWTEKAATIDNQNQTYKLYKSPFIEQNKVSMFRWLLLFSSLL